MVTAWDVKNSYKGVKEIKKTFLQLFNQTCSKELSLSITVALLLGVIPIIGTTTILVGFAALRLKLNLALMVVISYPASPLQFLLFVPFLRFGEWLFGVENSGMTFEGMKASFQTNFIGAISDLWVANVCAFIGWIIISVPTGTILHTILFSSIQLVAGKSKSQSAPVEQHNKSFNKSLYENHFV